MTATNFPTTGLVANQTIHSVGNKRYLWDGIKWKKVQSPDLFQELVVSQTLTTSVGSGKISSSISSGKKLRLEKIQCGSGTYSVGTTTLDVVEYETFIENSRKNFANPNELIVEAKIPYDIGGFDFSVVSVLDEDGDVLFLGQISSGVSKPDYTGDVGINLFLRIRVLLGAGNGPAFFDNLLPLTHESIKGLNEVGSHDKIYRRVTTKSELASGVFSVGDVLEVSDSGYAKYDVVSGGTPDGARVLNAGSGKTAVMRESQVLSSLDSPTFGSNVVLGPTSFTHPQGTVEVFNAFINVQPETLYKVTVDITTSNSGFVKILFGNDTVPENQVEAIYGDQTEGFWFDTEAILANGLETNATLTTNLYTFSLYTSSTGFTNLHISTDTNWGGTIASITIVPVIGVTAYNKIIPSDAIGKDRYNGLKIGSVERNDIALGDKSSLGMFVYDESTLNSPRNLAFGQRTLSATERGDECTAIGTFALQGNEGSANTASGHSSLRLNNKGQENTASGHKSGAKNTTGYRNSYFGAYAGSWNKTGYGNTAIGCMAGTQNTVSFNNCSLLGYTSEVTGSNQVQLGNSLTTTYAYGAVQDRSDERDKLDIKDLTDDHISFFMSVEWKQYRMNHRERYKERVNITDEDGNIIGFEVIEVENDGSRAGSRYHIGAIAQQVEEAMKNFGIDFAGLQHHSINGGEDVYTIGYQEFIGIQGLIIQRQQKTIESILERLDLAGI